MDPGWSPNERVYNYHIVTKVISSKKYQYIDMLHQDANGNKYIYGRSVTQTHVDLAPIQC